MSANPNLTGNELVGQLESWQDDINTLADYLRPYREARSEYSRCIALAITKLDEARMWIAEGVLEVPR